SDASLSFHLDRVCNYFQSPIRAANSAGRDAPVLRQARTPAAARQRSKVEMGQDGCPGVQGGRVSRPTLLECPISSLRNVEKSAKARPMKPRPPHNAVWRNAPARFTGMLCGLATFGQ